MYSPTMHALYDCLVFFLALPVSCKNVATWDHAGTVHFLLRVLKVREMKQVY